MSHQEITNDFKLHQHIMKLNYLKEEQELVVKNNVRELIFSIHPSVILRNVANKFSDKKEGIDELKSVGLKLGRELLIMKLFGKGKTFKSLISALLVKKAANYVINNHSDIISNGINLLQNYIAGGKEKLKKIE